MVETLSVCSIVSYILAGVFFLITVIMGVKFNIIKIVGDLSGRNARKNISRLREQNEQSRKQDIMRRNILNNPEETQPISVSDADTAGGETGVLNQNFTMPLQQNKVTAVLNDNIQDVLERDAKQQNREALPQISLNIIEEIKLVHTQETI